MRRTSKKQEPKYPRISLRIDPALLSRVDAVRGPAELSYGQIVAQALRRYLPDLEKFHAATK